MFLLFDVASQGLILGFLPESLGVLFFGVGLIVLAITLRWFMKRAEANLHRELEKTK
jgi:hypothetical protein